MKPPHDKTQARSMGMTLIESIIVILVMLVVIVVVFTGTRSWKKGSDRTACINNIRTIQHIVRAHQNYHGLPVQAPISVRDELIGPNLHLAIEPQCPSYGHYSYANVIPPVGHLAATCSLSERNSHYPDPNHGW